MYVSVIRLVVVLALGWALAIMPALAAPADAGGDTKKADTPAEKIKKVLDETTNLEISDQPLHLAVAQLREQTKLNIVLDRQGIANMGIDTESAPVNVKLQNVKLRSALRSMLGQYGLSYAIVGDAVVITSEELAVLRQVRQRVSIDLNRVQLTDALKQLSRETGTNLVLDARMHKESQAPVTLQLDDVPLDTAVRLMAEMAGLRPVRTGNVLFVTSKATAAEMRQDPDLMPAQPGGPGEGIFNPFIPQPGGIGVGGGIVVPKIGIAPGVPGVPVPPPAPPEDRPVRPDGTTNPPGAPEKNDR